jgi:hypothetical protein
VILRRVHPNLATPTNCLGRELTLTEDDQRRIKSIGQELLPVLQYSTSNPSGGPIPLDLVAQIQAAGGSKGLAGKVTFWLEHTPSSDGDLFKSLAALQQRFQTAAAITK